MSPVGHASLDVGVALVLHAVDADLVVVDLPEAADVFVRFVAVEGKGTLDAAESSLAANRLDDDQVCRVVARFELFRRAQALLRLASLLSLRTAARNLALYMMSSLPAVTTGSSLSGWLSRLRRK
eukprot:2816581-Prymnesium_polylepis.1